MDPLAKEPSPSANQDWPEVERILYADMSGKECGIDLDTGKLYALPKEYNRVVYPGDEIVLWAKDHHIDLFYPAKPGAEQLTCVELGLRAFDHTTWEKVTREDVRDFFTRLGAGKMETPDTIWADYATGAAPSCVYAFVTNEGSRGIVQIVQMVGVVGLYDDRPPTRVMIRYRIIEKASREGTRPVDRVGQAGAGGTGRVNPPSSMDGPDGALCRFLDAIRNGDERQTMAMLTTLTRKQEFAERHIRVLPLPRQSDTARFEIGSVKFFDGDFARVASKWTDPFKSPKERPAEYMWLLRKESEGWRIAGLEATVFEGQPPVLMDFEDQQQTRRRLIEAREAYKKQQPQGEGKLGAARNIELAPPPPADQDWPEVERTLYADMSGKECGIDLDTGKLYTLPTEYNRVVYPRDEIVRWAEDHHIDLFYPANPSFEHLTCVGLGQRAFDNTTWEKVTREDVRDFFTRLGAGKMEPPDMMSSNWADNATGAAPSYVYAFVTNEGSRGIVQIVGTVGPYENGTPSGVKIRYRIDRPVGAVDDPAISFDESKIKAAKRNSVHSYGRLRAISWTSACSRIPSKVWARYA